MGVVFGDEMANMGVREIKLAGMELKFWYVD
jgi:hypothetical protein